MALTATATVSTYYQYYQYSDKINMNNNYSAHDNACGYIIEQGNACAFVRLFSRVSKRMGMRLDCHWQRLHMKFIQHMWHTILMLARWH